MRVTEDVVDETGGSFNERFQLHARLGHGCSAAVYAAHDCEKDGRAAVKLAVRKPKIRWALVVSTFKNEARMLQRCVHPHIVGFRGLYEGHDEIALVLQLVDGGDCQHLLQRHGCLSEVAVGAIVTQLCDALSHLHGLGIIHRDVKLENILVDTTERQPRIWLCDLGHSCELSEVSGKDRFFGTVHYAAPEVLDGPSWSYGADVWSLGACMYAMLVNAPLRWVDGAPDLSPRTFLHVSTEIKLLLKRILVAQPHSRASFDAIASTLAAVAARGGSAAELAGMGLRRQPAGLGKTGDRSYSLLDLTTLEPTVKALPAGASGFLRPLSHGASRSPSLVSLASVASSDALTSLYDSAQASATAGRLAANGAGSPGTSRSRTERALARVLSRSVQIPARMRTLFGARDTLLELGGLGVRALDPSSGKESHSWRYDQILAVVDEQGGRRAGEWRSNQSGEAEPDRYELSMLVHSPFCCGLGALRLCFALRHEHEHRAVLARVQACLAAQPAHAELHPDESRRDTGSPARVAIAEPAAWTPPPPNDSPVRERPPPPPPALAVGPGGVWGLNRLPESQSEAGEAAAPRAAAQLPAPETLPVRPAPFRPAASPRVANKMLASKRISASCGSLDMLGGGSEPSLSSAQQEMLQRMRESMATLQKVRSTS